MSMPLSGVLLMIGQAAFFVALAIGNKLNWTDGVGLILIWIATLLHVLLR